MRKFLLRKVTPGLFKKISRPGYVFFFLFLGTATFLSHSLAVKLSTPIEYVLSEGETRELPKPLPRHLPTPPRVKGIYMTSWVAGTRDWRRELVDFVEKSEINAIVIDVKDYSGRVSFEVNDEELKQVGYSEKRISDIKEFLEELHRREIYVIARIAVFQDPHLASERPDLAIKRKSGAVWRDKKGLAWLDPAGKESWDFMVRVAREAERVGFDELNFDYVRFPSDGNLNDTVYPFWDGKTSKSEVLKSFFAYLEKELGDLSVPLSADIFGLTTWNTDDLNIGQILEDAVLYFDYVSPMIYPSHYPPGFQGYKNPAQHPYEVIKTAMERARERLAAIGQDPKKLRPWIQDFDLGAEYDAAMVRLEKQALYDAGIQSWLAWDSSNKYTRDAYDLAEE